VRCATDGLLDAAALVRELSGFRVTITARTNETFGAGTRGGHDDLVLAVALAVWGEAWDRRAQNQTDIG
jgi:hypothetical protein